MRETLNARTSFDQLKTIVVSSASQPRRDGLKTIMDELKPALRVDGFSPDYDCGIPESEKPDSVEVAWEKILVMGIALGIIPPEQVDKPWVEKILKLDPASKDINIENIGIWSGDIVTRVSQDPLAVFHTTELHRLNRDLEGKTKGQRRSMIAQDKREMIELYNRVDKENPYFYVNFELSMDYFSTDGQKRVVSFEIFMRYKKISQRKIRESYREGGTTWYSAPRLDLAQLAVDGKADLMMIRNAGQAEETWMPIDAALVKMLVRQGVMPAQAMFEFLTADVEGEDNIMKPARVYQDLETLKKV